MNWSGMQRLDADVVGRLAKYLNCKPEDLYEWVEDEEQEKAVAVG